MGSKLFSSDMLLSELIIPMVNSYSHNDFAKACTQLYSLSMFLVGFGEGIKDFPKPPKPKIVVMGDARSRQSSGAEYQNDCQAYFDQYYPIVMMRLGKYQQTMLKAIERNYYMGGVGE